MQGGAQPPGLSPCRLQIGRPLRPLSGASDIMHRRIIQAPEQKQRLGPNGASPEGILRFEIGQNCRGQCCGNFLLAEQRMQRGGIDAAIGIAIAVVTVTIKSKGVLQMSPRLLRISTAQGEIPIDPPDQSERFGIRRNAGHQLAQNLPRLLRLSRPCEGQSQLPPQRRSPRAITGPCQQSCWRLLLERQDHAPRLPCFCDWGHCSLRSTMHPIRCQSRY